MAAATKTEAPKASAHGARLYWIGLTRDCPVFRADVGGVALQQETFSIVRDALGNPKSDDRTGGLTKVKEQDGNTARLTDSDVERIKAAVEDRVVQVVSLPDRYGPDGQVAEPDRKRARVVRISGTRYTREDSETPLGRYVFILPADDLSRRGDGTRPTTLIAP